MINVEVARRRRDKTRLHNAPAGVKETLLELERRITRAADEGKDSITFCWLDTFGREQRERVLEVLRENGFEVSYTANWVSVSWVN